MERVFSYERHPGYNRLAGPGDAGLRHLELGIARIPRDEELVLSTDGREAVLVVLSGACTVRIGEESWGLARASVFAEPARAAYIPRHREYTLAATKPTDMAILMAPAGADYLPRLITSDQVEEHTEGAGRFTRRVATIVGPEFPCSRLLVGETFIEPGEWSSYPPHKHDEDRYPDEVRLESVAFYQIDPPQGFALQYLYNADRSIDEAHVVRNEQAFVAAVGYHPVAGAPGYSIHYLWGMAGDGHVMRSSLDPDHAWVAREAGVPERVAASS
ncbi:MAG: 5-deoxy-glucuronate isomerase [Anaerolineae bacterium]|nr:5-deoxy-glucuronate isomerase [Anaerolineae bacterium]